MQILGFLLVGIGALIGLIFGIQLLIQAFRASVLWGLGCLFLSFPVTLIFVATHWEEAKKSFLCCLLAIPFYIGGAILLASSGGGVESY